MCVIISCKQWDQFKDVPLGVLAHSTHFRGSGRFENGIEMPRVKLNLASQISAEDCQRLALGYVDPNSIDLDAWQHTTDPNKLFVSKAGEMLYRVKES